VLVGSFKREGQARRRWLTPTILSTQEAEIRRIVFRSQPAQIVRMWLKKTHHTHKKVGLMEWLKVKAVSSIPSTEKKKKKEREREREKAIVCQNSIDILPQLFGMPPLINQCANDTPCTINVY
jgi:hypothetical protein